MKEEILRYEEKYDDFPNIGIYFVGNRAVISTKKRNNLSENHEDVYYGLFFWLRIMNACRTRFSKIIIQHDTKSTK